MEQLIGTLGINGKIFIGQIVNFLIFAFVITRFVLKPIIANLQKRTEVIERSVADAKEAQQRFEQIKEEQSEMIREARKEASTLITDAQERAKTARTQVLEETRTTAKKMVEDAKIEIVQEREIMYKELKADVATLALQVAFKVMGEKMTDKKDEKMTADILKKLDV